MLTVAVLPGHTVSDFDSPPGLHPPLLEGERELRFFAESSTACETFHCFVALGRQAWVRFLRRIFNGVCNFTLFLLLKREYWLCFFAEA